MLSISNPAGISRLRIGVVSTDGTRAELQFVAPDFTPQNRFTPLVAVEPAETETPAAIISGAEVDGSDDGDPFSQSLPSDDEITREYLLRHDWTPVDRALYAQFVDPLNGETVSYLEACALQDARDFRDMLAERLSFEDTPLAELYGGE